MEALLPRVPAPLLEKLQIYFLNEFSVSIQNLQRFISSADNLRFTSTSLEFGKMGLFLQAYPHEGSRKYALSMEVYRLAHNWPLSTIAEILGALGPIFSVVVHLALGVSNRNHMFWSAFPSYNIADRAHWRDTLRLFSDVKTLCVKDGLVGDMSHALGVHDGEGRIDDGAATRAKEARMWYKSRPQTQPSPVNPGIIRLVSS